MLVINPLVLMDKQQLKSRMCEFFETVKQSPMWDKDTEMLLPGEIEYRQERQRRRYGIPLPASLYDELVRIGNEVNLDLELSLVPA